MTAQVHGRDTEGGSLDRKRAGTVTFVARALTILVAGALAVAMAAPGAGAHDDGTTSHLWLDHIKPMRDPGTINTSTNPVDWTKLKGVPQTIADGTDDGVDAAGFGLLKWGSLFIVDWTKVQRRVKTACSRGQAIKSINKKGIATCTAGPRTLSKTILDTGFMCNAGCTEGTLKLTKGTWSITATIHVRQADDTTDALWVECQLHAGGLSNAARHVMETTGDADLSMQLIATLTSNLNASVNCRDADVGEAQGQILSIFAMRVD
jgi:hypothetical protein